MPWFSHHFSSYVVRETSPGFSLSNEEVASPSDPKPLSLPPCGSHQGIPERFTSEQLFLTQLLVVSRTENCCDCKQLNVMAMPITPALVRLRQEDWDSIAICATK